MMYQKVVRRCDKGRWTEWLRIKALANNLEGLLCCWQNSQHCEYAGLQECNLVIFGQYIYIYIWMQTVNALCSFTSLKNLETRREVTHGMGCSQSSVIKVPCDGVRWLFGLVSMDGMVCMAGWTHHGYSSSRISTLKPSREGWISWSYLHLQETHCSCEHKLSRCLIRNEMWK